MRLEKSSEVENTFNETGKLRVLRVGIKNIIMIKRKNQNKNRTNNIQFIERKTKTSYLKKSIHNNTEWER